MHIKRKEWGRNSWSFCNIALIWELSSRSSRHLHYWTCPNPLMLNKGATSGVQVNSWGLTVIWPPPPLPFFLFLTMYAAVPVIVYSKISIFHCVIWLYKFLLSLQIEYTSEIKAVVRFSFSPRNRPIIKKSYLSFRKCFSALLNNF